MKKINRKKILQLMMLIFIVTIVIISIKHMVPTSKAELENIKGIDNNIDSNQVEVNETILDDEYTTNNLEENIIEEDEEEQIDNEETDEKVETEEDKHNVVYVAWTDGKDTNDGKTPDTAVQTLVQAYTILSKISGIKDTDVEDNYIVLMQNYDDETNTFGNRSDTITFSVPATITGAYGTINENFENNPEIYWIGGHPSKSTKIKLLEADTKFEYLTFKGMYPTYKGTTDGATAYIYCQGHNLTMGKGLVMKNYQDGSTANFGMPTDANQQSFHIIGGWLDCEFPEEWPSSTCTITIQSGSYSRICGGSRIGLSGQKGQYTGSADKHYKVKIIIDYSDEDGNVHNDLPSKVSNKYSYDIGLIAGGQTDCSAYMDSTIEVKNGVIGRIVGGSQGNDKKSMATSQDENKYVGSSTINIKGGYINELIGASQGRNILNNYYEGTVNINISGGKLGSSSKQIYIYSAGAAAFVGGTENGQTNPATVNITITGGEINGDIYGGSFGYSERLAGGKASEIQGMFYGNATINIKGGTINGNIYGGGRGSKSYEASNKLELAQLQGNITINISNNSKITGNIYGAGQGFVGEEYLGMAKVTGNVTINIENEKNILGKIYGGAESAQLIGNTYIILKNSTMQTDLFGGGNAGIVDGNTSITLDNGTVKNIYGGGDSATVNNTKIEIKNGNATNIYGGGNSSDVQATNINIDGGKIDYVYGGGCTGNVENDTNIKVANATITEIYGGGYSGTIGENINQKSENSENSNIEIVSGTITNVFGGGNLGEVYGNTNVTVGTDTTVTKILGIVYGGGRGEESDYETVSGSSYVTITGTDTDVENYGSSKLGKVAKEVYLTFKDYKTKNPTSLYKRMNGIDRATTVTFDHSYVLLENKAEDGTLKGIEDITNIVLPKESGLKISANGEILGDFSGGGELYLDSEVCLTVKGDMKDAETTLILNVKNQQISGGIDHPYMIVYGDSEADDEEKVATRLTSGEDDYEILTQKSEKTNNQTYYYIEKTIVVEDSIIETLVNAPDKVYKEEIIDNGNIEILNNTSFTNYIKVDYSLVDDGTKEKKYKNITKSITLEDSTSEIIIPEGTEITMIANGEYYSYIVPSNTTKIPLEKFSSFKNGTKYPSEFDLTEITDEQYVKINAATQTKTYSYPEEYRFIINFSNCKQYVENGLYCIKLDIQDDETLVDTKPTTNMVQISSRDYTYENNSENKTYQNNGNINIDGTLKINEIDSSIESLKNKGLSVRVKLEEDGKIIEIPQGTVLTINNNENFETQNGIIEAKLLKEITNLETIQDFNISLNMSDVLPIYRIEAGKYNLLIEIVLSEDDLLESLVQKTIEIPLTIVEMKSDSIGFKSEIQNMQNVASDKIQLINKGEKAERSIGLNYNGTLNNPNVKITILEKTGEFEYTNINNTDNANKIKIEINEKETYEISNITNNANLTINFSDKLSVGTYKILFELYDDNGEKQTESITNFIVWE